LLINKQNPIRAHTASKIHDFSDRLLGYADQAMRGAESSIEAARAINYAVNLCYAPTYFGCPVVLMVGDLARAELYVRLLLDHSTRHGLVLWHAYGRSHQGLLSMKRGDVATGLEELQNAYIDGRRDEKDDCPA
jgi:hypothetical protein